jgi:hypothetical protein
MSMIFQIRMIHGEDETFIRDYEVSYATTLLEFHGFISRDLGYDPMNMASFFISNERWEQLREFTLTDMGDLGDTGEEGPIPMERVTLGQVLHRNHDRLIYVFDAFDGRVMFLELMGSFKQSDEAEYPRVAFSRGDPPAQFDFSASLADNDVDLFEEAMGDYSDFGGDDDF